MKIKILLLTLLACLFGCGKTEKIEKTGLEDMVAHFERGGIKGATRSMPPVNADIVSTVTITLDTGGQGTKMVSVSRCKDRDAAARIFQEAAQNQAFSGTTRNGVIVMYCTFVPADLNKAAEIQELFKNYKP